MTIRRASAGDAALLARHRAEVWYEVGEWEAPGLAATIPVWTAFFDRCLRDSTYVAFIAEEAGESIGSGALLVHLSIPRPGLDSCRSGRVQSVYVAPAARRRGVAREIMQHLIRYAREHALIALTLHPSEEARPLYASIGFREADEMMLRLSEG